MDEILTSIVGLLPTNSPEFELPGHFTTVASNPIATRQLKYLTAIGMEQLVRTQYDPN